MGKDPHGYTLYFFRSSCQYVHNEVSTLLGQLNKNPLKILLALLKIVLTTKDVFLQLRNEFVFPAKTIYANFSTVSH